jgi:hypothetical protein
VRKLVLCGVFLIVLQYACYAQETGSLDLLNNTKQYDGKTVVYQGEVIGDIMVRGDYAWIHVNDGYTAIGIWVPRRLLKGIRYAGNYRRKGDIISVFGVFHRSCLEHGGDLDIHAFDIKIMASGSETERPVNKEKVYLGVSLLLFVVIFYAAKRTFRGKAVAHL